MSLSGHRGKVPGGQLIKSFSSERVIELLSGWVDE
jgi:hypothetical protein